MSDSVPTAAVRPPSQNERRCLIALLVLAAVLRLGIICWKPELLAEDRDMYWAIANKLAVGHGFTNPVWGYPTAYRPPLYPLILAGVLGIGGGVKLLGAVQIGLGVATVWLSWRIGAALNLKGWALLAASFLAVNPLLIQMTALAMTETLCAFLLTALLLVSLITQPLSWQHRWGVGMLFGLAVLCRPTVLAFGGLASLVCIASLFLRSDGDAKHEWIKALFGWLSIVLISALTVTPWALRNNRVFGQPIVTTTHGGYTLLLGNNDEIYQAEIKDRLEQPWDSRAWQDSLRRIHRGGDKTIPLCDGIFGECRELTRDRWMSDHAKAWIRQHPREFAELCWLRVKHFWNIYPGGADAGSLPTVVRWGMAVFFLVELVAAAVGLWRLRRDEWRLWWPLVLLVMSFALVHVVYWSNLRMRAPVEPVLALLAARGLSGWHRK